ncbi:MAG: transposase [Erysipelotrichaceae bacterium]|nr:transposase [Erysipelotrichaceae bacterium]
MKGGILIWEENKSIVLNKKSKHVKISKLDSYIYNLTKQFRERDLKLLEEKNLKTNREYKSIKTSKEVYILSKFKWVLLEKQSDIDYSTERKWCPFLTEYLDTFQKEKMFLDLDPHFLRLRELKEMYHTFDNDSKQNPEYAGPKLDELIKYYQNCDQQIFREFAILLNKYRNEIILSYTFVDIIDKNGETVHRRLSNAFIESFNRKPKDLKRAAYGLSNFQYARNRILWSTRNAPAMLAKPRDIKEFKVTTGKKRGHYKKKCSPG